jgi:hypothetical protein
MLVVDHGEGLSAYVNSAEYRINSVGFYYTFDVYFAFQNFL